MTEDEDKGVSLGRFLQLAVFAVGLFAFLHWFVFESIVIASGSMEPTLKVGTHAFLDKVTLRLRAPRRGEIIAFKPPAGAQGEYVKRVIAVAGDTIELKEKMVILNGAELTEHYAKHTRAGERLVGDDIGPFTVRKDCYFVLGDNRDESNDSSVWKDPATGAPGACLPGRDVRGLIRGFF